MKTVIAFIKKEVVLCAAILLAIISAFFVAPDDRYIKYIDYRTLAILFCLMAVMVGLRKIGVFSSIAQALLSKVKSLRMVTMILVLLCFISSMFITNDVALITFVPLTIIILKMLGMMNNGAALITTIVMQTIAANLGSMLTPIGNPQNLYLYGQSGMDFGSFIMLMLPYSLLSLAALIVWIIVFSRKEKGQLSISKVEGQNYFTADKGNTIRLIVYLGLFVLSLLTVIRLIPYWIVLIIVIAAILIADFRIFKDVDYCLLLTFIGFFIFVGNMARIPAVHDFIGNIVSGREVATSIISSQVISNVPAALLLSGFTDNLKGLIVGTNLGGLGTLIASMASLISFKLFAAEKGTSKGKYMLIFTVSNLVFLALLIALYLIIA